jgi:hypothetical protein
MKTPRVAVAALAALLLAACGGVSSLWPFGEMESTELSRRPSNATEYVCDNQKRFYVRGLDGGAVWLIAPDREIRLEKLAGADMRYGTGRVVLEISGQNALLTDAPAQFAGCKRADAKP